VLRHLLPDPDPKISVTVLRIRVIQICLLLFECTFTSFFKDKKVIKK
jgi:hypothetical protein